MGDFPANHVKHNQSSSALAFTATLILAWLEEIEDPVGRNWFPNHFDFWEVAFRIWHIDPRLTLGTRPVDPTDAQVYFAFCILKAVVEIAFAIYTLWLWNIIFAVVQAWFLGTKQAGWVPILVAEITSYCLWNPSDLWHLPPDLFVVHIFLAEEYPTWLGWVFFPCKTVCMKWSNFWGILHFSDNPSVFLPTKINRPIVSPVIKFFLMVIPEVNRWTAILPTINNRIHALFPTKSGGYQWSPCSMARFA